MTTKIRGERILLKNVPPEAFENLESFRSVFTVLFYPKDTRMDTRRNLMNGIREVLGESKTQELGTDSTFAHITLLSTGTEFFGKATDIKLQYNQDYTHVGGKMYDQRVDITLPPFDNGTKITFGKISLSDPVAFEVTISDDPSVRYLYDNSDDALANAYSLIYSRINS